MAKEKCEKDATCDTCNETSSCSQQEKEAHAQEERLKSKLSHIKHRIMVMSGKGGVGKSTVSTNLAVALSRDGFDVGLLDADIHGPNIPKMLGIEFSHVEGSDHGMIPVEVFPNLKVISMAFFIGDQDNPVVWRAPLKHNAISQFLGEVDWGNLDFLIVDLPPGTGDEPLSVAHLIKNVDGAVIVTTPQDVALLDSRKAVTFSRILSIPVIGIVENMSGLICPHCHKEIPLFKKGGGEKAARDMRVPFLGRIPIDPEMVTDCDRGMPFVMAHPDSEATNAFKEIAHRCKEYVGFKEIEKQSEREKFPYHFKERGGEEMKRIALASEDGSGLEGSLSAHFGRCPFYTFVNVEGDRIVGFEVVANPHYPNHQPGVIPQFIHSQKANVMIAGGMGPRAIDFFSQLGIDVATGAQGKIRDVVEAYLRGEIQGIVACEHHDHDGCGEEGR
jgi:ATP-binding protein involved in chromosome partitioning